MEWYKIMGLILSRNNHRHLSFGIRVDSWTSCGFLNTAPEQASESAIMCKECTKGQACCLAFHQTFTVYCVLLVGDPNVEPSAVNWVISCLNETCHVPNRRISISGFVDYFGNDLVCVRSCHIMCMKRGLFVVFFLYPHSFSFCLHGIKKRPVRSHLLMEHCG